MDLTECHLLVNGRESQGENLSRKQDAVVSLTLSLHRSQCS